MAPTLWLLVFLHIFLLVSNASTQKNKLTILYLFFLKLCCNLLGMHMGHIFFTHRQYRIARIDATTV